MYNLVISITKQPKHQKFPKLPISRFQKSNSSNKKSGEAL